MSSKRNIESIVQGLYDRPGFRHAVDVTSDEDVGTLEGFALVIEGVDGSADDVTGHARGDFPGKLNETGIQAILSRLPG